MTLANDLKVFNFRWQSGVQFWVAVHSALSCYWSFKSDEKVGIATVVFGLLAILFNPIIPVYLQNKAAWTVIDVVAAILLAIRYFTLKGRTES